MEEHINPRSEERADLRNAITASTIANSFGNKMDVMSFMPKFNTEEKKPITLEEFDGKMKCWGASIRKIKGNQ
jgi:hypothetical protein